MKKLIITMSALLVFFIGFIIWYRWDFGTNHGFRYGYYGDFNRVRNALASIPGIAIAQSWHNCDVTLEEFGFSVTMRSGKPVRIAIGERDRLRSLSGDALIQALKTEVQAQTR